jgi:hypothetical protein
MIQQQHLLEIIIQEEEVRHVIVNVAILAAPPCHLVVVAAQAPLPLAAALLLVVKTTTMTLIQVIVLSRPMMFSPPTGNHHVPAKIQHIIIPLIGLPFKKSFVVPAIHVNPVNRMYISLFLCTHTYGHGPWTFTLQVNLYRKRHLLIVSTITICFASLFAFSLGSTHYSHNTTETIASIATFSLASITAIYATCGCRRRNRPIIVTNVAFVVWVAHTISNTVPLVACALTRYVVILYCGYPS